jgi:UDP-GlcNAc:undecaprenyl-phosphate GlcNAc-1-phosphate transferase
MTFAYLIVFAIAFVSVLLLSPVAGLIASRLGAMDVPGELAIHSRPLPRTGGLAMLVAFLAAVTYAWWSGTIAIGQSSVLWGLVAGGVLIALAGLLDDLRQISPLLKFLLQFLAASVAMGLGVQVRFLPLAGVGLALTLLYLVGSANALNLLDGMDGLAGGVAFIAALSFGLVAAVRGNGLVAALALALGGAVLGFLPFNLPQARLFMGDTGSLFLGFTLAALGALLTDRPYSPLCFAVPLTVLGVLILDTALAMARRFRRQDDVFSGDREHTYDVRAGRWAGRNGRPPQFQDAL